MNLVSPLDSVWIWGENVSWLQVLQQSKISSNISCDADLRWRDVLNTSALCSSAVIVLLFSLVHIIRGWDFSLSGILNVAIPVDFFGATPYRFIYCIILSSLAADIINDAVNPDLYYRSDNGVLDAFLFFAASPTVIFLRQSLLYFPVLSCISTCLPATGHFLGLLYTLLMGASSVCGETVILRGCSKKGHLGTRDVLISLGIALPSFLCYVAIILWFYYRSFMEAVYFLVSRRRYFGLLSSNSYTDYVVQLLKSSPQASKSTSRRKSIFQNLRDGLAYVLPWRSSPHVRFPLAFLAAISMSFTVSIQLFIWLVAHEEIYLWKAWKFVEEFNITVDLLKTLMPSQAVLIETVYYDARSFVLSYQVLFPLAHWTGWILSVFFALYLIQNFHKHLLRVAHGDLSFLVSSEPLPSPAFRLASAMRYISFQIGHILLGFMLFSLIVLILGTIGLFYYYAFKNQTFYAIHYWSIFMVPYMWAFVMHTGQLVLSRYVFLKKAESADGTFVTIRFRQVYILCTYLFLGFNVFYAGAMSFLRILGSLIFNICMIFRLDRDLYMRGLEGWDLGHRTYVSYLYLESTTNNAIVRTFVNLLQQSVLKRHRHRQHKWEWLLSETPRIDQTTSSTPDTLSVTSTESLSPANIHSQVMRLPPGSRSRLARNRWHVAYTLIRNPGLRRHTGSNILHS